MLANVVSVQITLKDLISKELKKVKENIKKMSVDARTRLTSMKTSFKSAFQKMGASIGNLAKQALPKLKYALIAVGVAIIGMIAKALEGRDVEYWSPRYRAQLFFSELSKTIKMLERVRDWFDANGIRYVLRDDVDALLAELKRDG